MSRATGEFRLEPAIALHCSCQQETWGHITEGMVNRTLGSLWCPMLMISILGCHISIIVM